jgi:hypothetical protein
VTNLNAPISGVTMINGAWTCFELRVNGSTVSARLVRIDTGQFFVHSGNGSWSNTPQGVSGTTGTSGAGCYGAGGSDGVYLYFDNWYLDAPAPSIDAGSSFMFSNLGATKQLTAGGYTDPYYGVTWLSSVPGVATVSASGLVTAVATGSTVITAKGKRDTGQTATITVSVVTTYTFTGPNAGFNNHPSGNFTVTPNGPYTGTITLTPSGGGLSTPIVLTFSGSATPQTFTITPTAVGTVTLTPTNNGGLVNPVSLSYAVTASTYTLTTPSPSSGGVGTPSGNFTVTPNGIYTGTITLTPSGGGLLTPIVLTFSNSFAPQTFTITPTTAGTVTLTPTNSGSLVDSAPVTYTVTVSSYALIPPSQLSGQSGVTSGIFTVVPNGPYTGHITITPSGGGIEVPIILTFNNSSVSQSFTITPISLGTVALTATNDGGVADPHPVSYSVTSSLYRVMNSIKNTVTTQAIKQKGMDVVWYRDPGEVSNFATKV